MQEHFTQQRSSANPSLAHAQRVGLVDFWLEQLCDQGKEDFAEYRCPFFVVLGGEIIG